MHFSTNSPPSPNAASASADARENAVVQLAGVVDAADAAPAAAGGRLQEHREADLLGGRLRGPGSSSRPVPGTTGTPALSAAARAVTLSPTAAMTSAGGPANATPASAHAVGRRGSSARNP